MTGTSFKLTGGSPEAGGYAALWVRGAILALRRARGRSRAALDGEVTTGADAARTGTSGPRGTALDGGAGGGAMPAARAATARAAYLATPTAPAPAMPRRSPEAERLCGRRSSRPLTTVSGPMAG